MANRAGKNTRYNGYNVSCYKAPFILAHSSRCRFFVVPLTLIFPRDPPTTYPYANGAGRENQKNFNPEASYQGVSSSCSFPPDFYPLLPQPPIKRQFFHLHPRHCEPDAYLSSPYVGLRPASRARSKRDRENLTGRVCNNGSTIINFHRCYRDFSSSSDPFLQLSFSFPSFLSLSPPPPLLPGPSIFRFIIVNLLPNSSLRRDINERSHVPFDEQLINAKIPRFDTETSLKFNKYVSFEYCSVTCYALITSVSSSSSNEYNCR